MLKQKFKRLDVKEFLCYKSTFRWFYTYHEHTVVDVI